MIKFASDILNSDIFLFQDQAILGKIKEIVYSTDGPEILGFFVMDPVQKRLRVIQPQEINNVRGNLIIVNGYDSLIDIGDLVRLKESAKTKAKIIGEKVETESGYHLGKVNNVTLNLEHWIIDKLYVTPVFGLNFISKDLIVPARKIIRIEKKKVIVSDEFIKEKSKAVLPVRAALGE